MIAPVLELPSRQPGAALRRPVPSGPGLGDALMLLAGLVATLLILFLLRAPAGGAVAGVGEADGRIGDRVVSALDVDQPAVGRLDPALRAALQSATRDAATDGLPLRINSGWRSAAYQQALLDRAVEEYGDLREASRWVATPSTSEHVRGAAADVGPPAAARWLGRARVGVRTLPGLRQRAMALRAADHGRRSVPGLAVGRRLTGRDGGRPEPLPLRPGRRDPPRRDLVPRLPHPVDISPPSRREMSAVILPHLARS